MPKKGASLDAVVTEMKGVRACRPQLVLVTLPPQLLGAEADEHFIRQLSWMVNWSLPFGGSVWTVVGVDAALMNGDLTQSQQGGAELLKDVLRAHDLDWIEGKKNIQQTLDAWFDRQLSSGE